MSNIRDIFSSILGMRITNDNWMGAISLVEREGQFNNTHRNHLLVALGKEIEKLQNRPSAYSDTDIRSLIKEVVSEEIQAHEDRKHKRGRPLQSAQE